MKKSFTLHLDALLVIVLVFLLALGFIAYQRSQYSDLLKEHVQLQWDSQNLEANVSFLKVKLEQCGEQKDTE
jgi:predicted ABC-type exoprotein transport system permease subunit